MSLKFAKDRNVFSASVEALRKEGVDLTDENIEKEYNRRVKGGKKSAKSEPEPEEADESQSDEPEEESLEEKPNRRTKNDK